MSVSIGEPISGGQAARGWDELTIHFDQGIDLEKIRALLQQAKERVGSPGETVTAFNLVAIYFSPAAYERAQAALEVAGRIHPSRLVVLIAEAHAGGDSVTARVSALRSGGAVTLERFVLTAPVRCREAFNFAIEHDRVVSFSDRMLLLRADRD